MIPPDDEDRARLQLNSEHANEAVIIHIRGRLDDFTSVALSEEMAKAFADGVSHIALDCSNLLSLTSMGIRALLAGEKELGPRGGKIVLYGVPDSIREILEITALDTIFPMFANSEEALAHLAATRGNLPK